MDKLMVSKCQVNPRIMIVAHQALKELLNVCEIERCKVIGS